MDIQLWREILQPYEIAVDELTMKFNNIIKEYHLLEEYSPIEMVTGRVKRISSILEKCQKKNISLDDVCDKVEDIAGLRIICQFVEDINRVVMLIHAMTDIRVLQEKDYITNMKASGYRSYHMIIEYTVQTLRGPRHIKAEIQIRTLAMNFWATIEHSLQYKYKQNIPEHIRERLSSASEAVLNLDNEMGEIREEILDSQNSFRIKANIITEILNLLQNLYKKANKREILKIQDEFYRIYKADDIALLNKFLNELDIIAEGYRAQGLDDSMF